MPRGQYGYGKRVIDTSQPFTVTSRVDGEGALTIQLRQASWEALRRDELCRAEIELS